MLIDVIKHEMIPEHQVMTREEQNSFLEKLNITKEQLPKISDSDAVLNELKCKAGDIIRVKRKSLVSGEAIYYRVVVKQ
ncbi:MAG: DNA-directed RNA polymerase subunit H [Nanoarchaeota archaeon]|nr:DNA-directed RNA polymerase subunit H [Nanoarchaeota archaeon]MBU1135792.1 DNA-directed RNA polymerase subunit H [Nanoarchaeota archaeon]MBU2519644.1 DNA-directed RNA polymerase subunit H [Nanoarchaeota archaeon]